MTENLEEASADYETAMRILIEEGFDGYINSEYGAAGISRTSKKSAALSRFAAIMQ